MQAVKPCSTPSRAQCVNLRPSHAQNPRTARPEPPRQRFFGLALCGTCRCASHGARKLASTAKAVAYRAVAFHRKRHLVQMPHITFGQAKEPGSFDSRSVRCAPSRFAQDDNSFWKFVGTPEGRAPSPKTELYFWSRCQASRKRKYLFLGS